MMRQFGLTCSPAVFIAEVSLNDSRSTTRNAFSMRTVIFPILLIALDLGASIVYAAALDWRCSLTGPSDSDGVKSWRRYRQPAADWLTRWQSRLVPRRPERRLGLVASASEATGPPPFGPCDGARSRPSLRPLWCGRLAGLPNVCLPIPIATLRRRAG